MPALVIVEAASPVGIEGAVLSMFQTTDTWDVPVTFVAERVLVYIPAVVGVPVIRPVAVFNTRPGGRLAAANDVGRLRAEIQ
jgi:hypothetical protein